MLKDYVLPTVPEPDPDNSVFELLRGMDDPFEGMAIEIDEWEHEDWGQRFFRNNYPSAE